MWGWHGLQSVQSAERCTQINRSTTLKAHAVHGMGFVVNQSLMIELELI